MIDNDVPDRAAVMEACRAALDELTASLTQVMKAVSKVHRAVKRLDEAPTTSGDENRAAPLG